MGKISSISSTKKRTATPPISTSAPTPPKTSTIIFIILFMTGISVQLTNAYNQFVEQHLAMEPQDQIAVVGARVTLPCRVINKQGILQWTKDDFGLGTRRRLIGFDRYSMIGSDEEGDYSLQIYPITMDDNAQFQCQVSPGGHGHPGVRSRYATLTVLVSPDPPIISQGDFLETTEDREIHLECISMNGKPAAEITWIDGIGNVLTENVEYVVEPSSPDTRRFTAKSILKLKPNKDYHNRTIICQAQNTVDKAYRTAQIRLEVQYAPKVIVKIIEGCIEAERIPELNTISLSCNVDANPYDITYQWYLNNDLLINQTAKILTIPNITRDYQNAIVKCVAKNLIGISSDTEVLDVIYQPSFLKRPENVEADNQEEVELICQVDANPNPEIFWVFDPIDRINYQPRVVGTTNNLKIIASIDTAGRYFCKVDSPGFIEIRAEAQVLLKGPPKIISSNEQFLTSSNRNDDGSCFIECIAISIPRANHVAWSFNGDSLENINIYTGGGGGGGDGGADSDPDSASDTDGSDNNSETNDNLIFMHEETIVPNGIKSKLKIEIDKFQSTDKRNLFGKYSCTIVNSYGTDTLDITFSEKITYSITILAAGSMLILLILIVGISTIVYCVRITNVKELPPADLIPKESVLTINCNNKKNTLKKGEKPEIHEYQESNSGSYSTTTTISINKNDLIATKAHNLSIPVQTRYSGTFGDNLSIHTNQSSIIGGITGSGGGIGGGGSSYVDYARDYYSPTVQNANNCLLQIQRDMPTFV